MKTFSNMSTPDLQLTLECYAHELKKLTEAHLEKVFQKRAERLRVLIAAVENEIQIRNV